MAVTMALVPLAVSLLATQFLLLCTTTIATVTTVPGFSTEVNGAAPPVPAGTVGGGGGLPKLPFPFPGGLPHHLPFPFSGGLPHHQLPFPFPGGGPPALGADCLKAVHQAESCVVDVLRSLVSPPGDTAGAAACCAALQAVGDRCFRGVLLPVSPIRALYAPLVKHACGVPSQGLPGGPRV